MEQDISPLEQQLSNLSCDRKDKFVIPRRQRSRSASMTPGFRIVKPSQQAFHSTGLLSKKQRTSKESAPDTPVKHKNLLDQIEPHLSLNTPAKQHHTPQYPEDTPASIKTLRLHLRSPLAESPTNFSKRPHFMESASPLKHEFGVDSPINNVHFKTPNEVFKVPQSFQSPNQPPRIGMPSNTPFNDPSSLESLKFSSPVVKSPFFHTINSKRHQSAKKSHMHTNPITFQMFISRHRVIITKGFFQALDGREPFLSDFLRQYDNGVSDQDYFETSFELLGRLGHGAFADAFHVLDLNDSVEYAIKKTRQPFTGYKDWFKLLI